MAIDRMWGSVSRPARVKRRTGRRQNTAAAKRWAQVLCATLLVAGTPVAVVWWLRASDAVTSPLIGVAIGMAASLCVSQLGRLVWESTPGSEDLLFSELMLWGFLRRRRSQRRLASALDMVGPMSAGRHATSVRLSATEQAKLLERLVERIETRDRYLHGHSRRVARHAWMIARQLGLGRAEVARIRTAAAIHDVGKIQTPRAILHKPSTLTDDEYATIKEHPVDGAQMVGVLRDEELTAMVRHHHERLDGTGYPAGLSGEQIPLGARIIAVADTFDAITSERPYRDASTHKKAIEILREDAGSRLDPAAVAAFCSFYAGRRPMAVWALVASIPERAVAWLAGGVGSVASATQAVALAAVIGGAAATSAALAGPAPAHTATSARPLPSAAAKRAPLAGVATRPADARSASNGRSHAARRTDARAAARSSKAAPSGVGHAAQSAQALSPQSTATRPGPSSITAAGDGSSGQHHGAGTQTPAPGNVKTSPGKSWEAPRAPKTQSSGKSGEAPGHTKSAVAPGKSGEAPGAPKTESPGKSGGAPGAPKTESAGKSGEAPGPPKTESSGKSEEATGHGKPEEASGNGGQSQGHSQEAHG
jgi:putative nucleotidyltransferase with HDIG domain